MSFHAPYISMPAHFPVAAHTNNVGQGSTFVAIIGQHYDGTLYIPQAIAKGARRIVVEKQVVLSSDIESLLVLHGVSVVRVDNARKALAQLSAQAAGYPSKKLTLFGITGTKGKTTSTYMLESILKNKGYKVARLSTVSNSIDGHELPAPLTTAQPDYLHQFFLLCLKHNITHVVMEVAAQASTFYRLEDLAFDGFIFTNLDREHAELYPTMEDYFQAKNALLSKVKPEAPIIVNVDDVYGQRIAQERKVTSFAFNYDAQYCYTHDTEGVLHYVHEQKQGTISYAGARGLFNAYNIAGIFTLLDVTGLSILSSYDQEMVMPKVPGRLEEYVLPNGARAYIDYAHTPGSFQSLLSVIRTWSDHVIVVFGAGGGKDHLKRPLMGSIAASLSDHVIITNDNPRHEDPMSIVQQICAGIVEKDKVIVELDRVQAIQKAYLLSKKNSIIMLLGKGPDEYQLIGTQKIPLSEKNILSSFIK